MPNFEFSQENEKLYAVQLFPASVENKDNFFCKTNKTYFFGSFLSIFGNIWFIFFQKRALTVSRYYNDLTSCKKSQKNTDTDRLTDRKTDGQTRVKPYASQADVQKAHKTTSNKKTVKPLQSFQKCQNNNKCNANAHWQISMQS